MKDLAQQFWRSPARPLKLGVQQGWRLVAAPGTRPLKVAGAADAPGAAGGGQQRPGGQPAHGEIDTLLNCQPIEAPDTVSLKLADEAYVALLPSQHPFHTQTCLSSSRLPSACKFPPPIAHWWPACSRWGLNQSAWQP